MPHSPLNSVKEPADLSLVGVPHAGSHLGIGQAFQRMAAGLAAQGLGAKAGSWVALYHNSPGDVAEDKLRSHACCLFPADADLPDGFDRVTVPAGAYAEVLHTGPYDQLPNTWVWFRLTAMGQAGLRAGPGASVELYLNDPTTTAPNDLRTRLLIPIG